MDRLRAHEAKKVKLAAEHRDRIELFFLPRYAPERNADEYLNNDVKGWEVERDWPAGESKRIVSRIPGFSE